jgi:uncharacterized membrane protein YbhN (UPF0104 family)
LLLAVVAAVPFEEVTTALWGAKPWLVVAGFALLAPKLLTAGLRMVALSRAQGLRLGLGGLVALNLATSFYALFLPGHLAAGAVRWYKLTRVEGRPGAALAVVAFSRLIELEVTLAIGLGFWALDAKARALHALPALIAALRSPAVWPCTLPHRRSLLGGRGWLMGRGRSRCFGGAWRRRWQRSHDFALCPGAPRLARLVFRQ